jgi:hypothetical protein
MRKYEYRVKGVCAPDKVFYPSYEQSQTEEGTVKAATLDFYNNWYHRNTRSCRNKDHEFELVLIMDGVEVGSYRVGWTMEPSIEVEEM